MNDAEAMRLVQRIRHLSGHLENRRDREGPPAHPLGQLLALDQLHHDEQVVAVFGDVVCRRNGRSAEQGCGAGLLQKARATVGVASIFVMDELQRDVAAQPRVARPVHVTHAAGAEVAADLVVEDGAADGGHGWRPTK